MTRAGAGVRSRPRRPIAWLAAALVAAVVAPALAAEPAGELRIGLPRLPVNLDPAAVRDEPGPPSPTLLVHRQIFEGLVEVGERGDIAPGLAAHWSVSRDGLTWTFRLRPDVQFHNGAPLTADVVVASLQRRVGPQAPHGADDPPWARALRGPDAVVREVRRGEAGTVQILLAQPFSPLLAVLAHPGLAVGLAQNDGQVPFSGTGPYRVAARGADRLVLEAVPGRSAGAPPRTPRLVFLEVGDDADGLAGLGPGGGLDVYFPARPPTAAGPGLQTVAGSTWESGLLAPRVDDGAFARKGLRQAVSAALDPALIGPALGRTARPLAALMPPGAWGAREMSRPPFEPARARRLVTEAQATTATLLVRDGDDGLELPRLAEAIRLSLAVAGLTVAVRAEPADAYGRALRQGDAELALIETRLGVDDPHFGLRPLLASDAAVRGSATNVAFYRNPAIDGLLHRGGQFAFRPERLRLYERLQAQVAEDLPYIPLYVRLQWAVARPEVQQLRLDPSGRHRLDRVWLPGPELPPAPPAPPPPAPPVPGTVLPPAPPLPPPPPVQSETR
jgi:peptide/nickel transport system substrate-binding protein